MPGQEEAKPRGRIGGKKMGKNAPKILGLDSVLSTVLGGRRPEKIPGLTPYTTLTLVSEIGTDLSTFGSAKSFTSWLGDFYRRLRAAKGGLIACKALGRKLAVLDYNVMTKGVEFVEEGLQKAQELARLERWAKKVNMAVVPFAATEGST